MPVKKGFCPAGGEGKSGSGGSGATKRIPGIRNVEGRERLRGRNGKGLLTDEKSSGI